MFAADQTIAALALEHPECEETLRGLGLDYACGGAMSLAAACAARGVPLAQAQAALDAAAALGPDPMLLDAGALSTPDLLAELQTRHHAYAKSALRVVVDLAAKVAEVHGDRHLIELSSGVALLSRLVTAQLEREETRLFPLLEAGAPSPELPGLLAASRKEHEQVVELLGRIRPVAEYYSPPAEACRSQRSLYAELAALDQDLTRHAHLELNVLHVRAGAWG
jgi:regulator of cell morphogenesis and NO signaling